MERNRYAEIAGKLRKGIMSGAYADDFPSERSLMEKFDVSHSTIRRAFSELEKEGLLSREHGRGTFVNKPGRVGNKRTMALAFIVPERTMRKKDDLSGRGKSWTKRNDDALGPFYINVFCGAMLEAQRHGYNLILDTRPENIFPMSGMKTRKADAILAVVPDEHELFKKISEFIPVIMVGHDFPGENFPAVFFDDLEGAFNAVGHLIKSGHRRIACWNEQGGNFSFYQRLCGYRKALETSGIKLDNKLELSALDENILQKLLGSANPPSAIFCQNDDTALRLLHMCHRIGCRVPDDLSVVGFDNLDYTDISHPPLTTVDVPKEEIGRLAVRKAVSYINGELKPEQFREKIPMQLIVRESTKLMNCKTNKNKGGRNETEKKS